VVARAEAVLLKWWNANDVLRTFQKACNPLLYAGRSPLRMLVPAGLTAELDADGQPLFVEPSGTLEEVIEAIFVTAPKLDECTVALDENTMRRLGIYLYRDIRGNELLETSFLGTDKRTVLRVVPHNSSATGTVRGTLDYLSRALFARQTPATSQSTFDLGGNLMHYLMERDALVTEQVMQNQALLNMALTMLPRNVVLGGFLERIYFNVRRPTERVPDPANPGQFIDVELDVEVGTGRQAYLSGTLYGKEDDPRLAEPRAQFREPVPVTTFEDTARIALTNIYDEMFQRYVLMGDDATASGLSRITAKADWVISLGETAPVVNRAMSTVLNNVLRMAAQFAGEADVFRDIRVEAQCVIDLGPLLPEERKQIVDEVERRARTTASGMTALGIEDPDAELAALDEERFRVGRLDELGAYVASIKSLISHEEALRLLRYDDQQIAKIRAEMSLAAGEQPSEPLPTAAEDETSEAVVQ